MISLGELVAHLSLRQTLNDSQGAIQLRRIAPLDKADSGDLSFLSSAKYRKLLGQSAASAVLVSEQDSQFVSGSTVALVVDDPYVAYARVSHLFDPAPKPSHRVHPSAVLAESASLGQRVSIGPLVVVGENVTIGDDVHIDAHAVIADGAAIGAGTCVHAGVKIGYDCQVGEHCLLHEGAVIGSDGFGFAPTKSGWEPIAQIGRVLIGDRVSIGANTTIDRGAVEDTVIERDVIIDNLVQIGHNVRIGAQTAVVSQVGIAGSTQIGKACTIGGQAGFAGHLNIVDQSHFTGQAMVTKGTSKPGLYSSGIPAMESKDWRRLVIRLKQLEDMHKRLKKLEEKEESDHGIDGATDH